MAFLNDSTTCKWEYKFPPRPTLSICMCRALTRIFSYQLRSRPIGWVNAWSEWRIRIATEYNDLRMREAVKQGP